MKIKLLAASIAVSQLAGIIGAIFTIQSIPTWYNALNKPAFAPNGQIISIVWITLYTMIGVALYLVWEKGIEKKEIKNACIIFGIQLALNALWSILFFGMHSPLLGLVGIAALWLSIAATIAVFLKIDKNAAFLLVPYLAWVTIAGYLNYLIWAMN